MNIFNNGSLSFSNNSWHLRGLFYCLGISLVIYITYFYNYFHAFWEELDDITFYVLNGSVVNEGLWAKLSAISNSKLYDVLSAGFLVLVLAAFILAGFGKTAQKRLAAVIFMGLYVTITTVVRRKSGFLEYDRNSPSAAGLLPFIDLSEMYPEIKPKVASDNSFPSDHGIFCILYVTFFWFYAGWRWGVAVLILMPLFIIPRLISGAHWLSDTAVGGVVFALPVIAVALYTPFAAWCCRGLEKLINRIADRMPFPKPE